MRLISAPPMNATVHAAISSPRNAQFRVLGELAMTIAACTIFWGWPEIMIPAQARAGIAFGLAVGLPSGVLLWTTYQLFDALLARLHAVRTRQAGSQLQVIDDKEGKKRQVLAGFRA